MSPLAQQVVQGIECLPEASQQQVLDFIEFLIVKHQESDGQVLAGESEEPKSFAEAAGDIIGMGEGPGDLSTNPDYMKGYGQ